MARRRKDRKSWRARTPRIEADCAGLVGALEQAMLGDELALCAWFGHAPPVLRRCLRDLGVASADVKGGAQIVVLRVWKFLRSGRSVAYEQPWLARIVRNVAADLRQRRHPTDEPLDAASPIAADEDPFQEVDDADEVRHWRGQVQSALHMLPQPNRKIARLRLTKKGATRRAMRSFLIRWSRRTGRPIGPDQALRYWRETLPMVRAAVEGEDLKGRWPRRFSTKNRWTTTPPPQFHSDGE